MPGPVPNRSGDHSRARDANRSNRPELRTGESLEANIPEPNPDWGKTARMVWESFGNSGQKVFWEESDWAAAYVATEWLDRLEQNPLARGSAMNQATVWAALKDLMMTEAERRRARIELEKPRPSEEPRSLAAVRNIKDRLGK